jgi:hypothetical protein
MRRVQGEMILYTLIVHTVLTVLTVLTALTVLILHPYCTHTVLVLYSYCTVRRVQGEVILYTLIVLTVLILHCAPVQVLRVPAVGTLRRHPR